jgi:uncharacterized protein (DUF2126 family)/transglutaminase-like putative cysteine protease
MSIRVALHHTTHYHYDRLVTLLPHVIRLRPAPHCRTPVVAYSLRVEPSPHFLNWQQDPYGNYLAQVVFPKPSQEFKVEVDLVAEMTTINPFDFFVANSAEHYPFTYDPVLKRELVPYLETLPAGPQLTALVDALRRSDVRTVDHLVAINQRFQQLVRYVIRMEPGIQSCEETLTRGSGSCRDSAWLLVQLLRRLGLAARFVSGYLIQLTADVKPLEGPAGPATDFTDLHAWAETYIPGAGWIGLDPTSGLFAGEGHLPLACAADPITAAPITGAYEWSKGPGDSEEDRCQEDFAFHMAVTRIHETPRVTKPYTEEQWKAIDALGRGVDADLGLGDVRLTMGGEPTFVSIDDRDAPEWNLTALGPAKRRRAEELLVRLRDRFAPGALLHHGQGKWYPGESLPRWAFGCYWRRDGVPVWQDPALIAAGAQGHGAAEAQCFLHELAERLGVNPVHAMPGHEDAWYYLWRERLLPANVDPLQSRLDDPEERRRLAQVFERGLGTAVGYALPLRAGPTGGPSWESGPLFLRREHLFLIPGDSPMGYRLPLDSLPWEVESDRQQVLERDPFEPREPLADRPRRLAQQQLAAEGREGYAASPGANGLMAGEAIPGMVRTALCVEPREGVLHVFMPPQRNLEDYLDLVRAVEETAAKLHLPIRIEGYTPPSDHRLNHFQITPDPGVIEVNVHPAHSWQELVGITTGLYEEAQHNRLSTEKFMLDGRHTGTGGGNHIVLGGPKPADSPFLRRPDLLRSLVSYWHNHPALSYLFSGLFIGPTSQAPRVDEARNDSVYELEIALGQIANQAGQLPWHIDRVLRHLLVDVTGNTHRTEFCIDKLFPPETSGGRRGLVELRSFEMPPHARMSLVQQLLVRSLIAWFWSEPYQRKLVRWGTEVHDRFMLPHFVEDNIGEVLDDLRQAGYPLDRSWFAPHVEFRFPALGAIASRGVMLELRQAIEPWHVLGEEPSPGGTARYVDSSVERLQVKVNGLIDSRHVVTCNGRRVPLFPTGVNGEYVAGVRYRAWQPPSCLHPTIPVHAPLVFDLVDLWSGRSVAGCTYHVAHPGGRAYDTFPVNALEAEARRAARFFAFGHTPGPMAVPPVEIRPEAPLTLDLRVPAPVQSAVPGAALPAAPEEPTRRRETTSPAGTFFG